MKHSLENYENMAIEESQQPGNLGARYERVCFKSGLGLNDGANTVVSGYVTK